MKHEDVISRMTLEEKAAFLSGSSEWQTRAVQRLGIPSVFCSDGPHGIRKQTGAGDHLGLNESQPATCFPTAAAVACSWDEKLGEEVGRALGAEAAAQDVDILLGPGLNIKRSPLCGRNFEYFSEDPYLSGKMAASYIKGIQSRRVCACPKHFAVNNQELRRMAMNSVIDERTLREIYLTGFEIAVKEGGAKAIMSSYNEVNGVYANENKHLLQDILRDEWGFDGIVISDWGGSNDHVEGVRNGSNLEMPNPGLSSAREILDAVKNGKLEEKAVDQSVDELLSIVLEASHKEKPRFEPGQHHELARRAAAESAVLLKNAEKILPLKPESKVAVIGDFAVSPRYQGAGSSMVNPTQLDTIASVIHHYQLQCVGIAEGYLRTGEEDAEKKKAALELAEKADIVLYFFGLDEMSESEGLDRQHMKISPNQIDLLESLSQQNKNIVGIISAGASVEMPWHHCCKALLHTYLNGQAGASAVMDILTGKVNPSGKLGESYPFQYKDTPAFSCFPAKERNAEYREGIYTGYRYYDTAGIPVHYPFGYGLSYTTFAYKNLRLTEQGVQFTVKNTGNCAGAEIAQMYVSLPQSRIFRAKKELKGFSKVYLEAGEEKDIFIGFDDKTFRYWNVSTDRWEIEEGSYLIQIGANVSDIRLSCEKHLEGTTKELPYRHVNLPSYQSGKIQNVDDSEFCALLGTPIPDGSWSGELTANDAICQMYYAKSWFARFIYGQLSSRKIKSEKSGKPDLNILFIYNMPFRAIAKMTAGAVSMDMVDGMVLAVNGHFFKGLSKVIRGYFSNRRANKDYEELLQGK